MRTWLTMLLFVSLPCLAQDAATASTVRQLWDSSEDGVTWTVLFDGLYEKVAAD